jgi:hypothetical protein
LILLALLVQKPTATSFLKRKKKFFEAQKEKEEENCGSIKMFTIMIDSHQHFCTEKSSLASKAIN